MKKGFTCLLAMVLILSLLVVISPKAVSAEAGDIGGGAWVTPGSSLPFTLVNIDKAAGSAPSWLQQLSEGIKISAPAKICYPFRGGEFNWVPQIMRLNGDKWIKTATTQEYLNSEEAMLYACAQPAISGTYGLFGYYNGPAVGNVQAAAIECDDSNPNTIDTVVGGVCVHNPLNCDDGAPSTNDYAFDGHCIHSLEECADGDNYTIDSLNNGICRHTLINCDDDDTSTFDSPSGDVCIHLPISS